MIMITIIKGDDFDYDYDCDYCDYHGDDKTLLSISSNLDTTE